MDTTKKYIKMCEEAREIQQEHNIPTEGDWFVDGGLIEIFTERDSDDLGEIEYRRKYSLWLPRQDQLQEIVKDKVRDNQKTTHAYIRGSNPEGFINACLLTDFYSWQERTDCLSLFFTSMEQLWLAFAMWEKFQKIWDDEKEEWVKET